MNDEPIRPRPSTSKPERGTARGDWAYIAIIAIIIILIFVALNLLWFRDNKPRDDSGSQILTSEPATTTPPTVFTVTNLPPPITDAATTTITAARAESQVQVTEAVPPPFDPVAYVNSLDYCWQCPAPAMEAYRVVATFYGWSEAQIFGRAEFAERIMAGESAFCWNSRAWSHDTYLLMPCTERNHQGTRDDVGFGQITNVLRPFTCEKVNICSIADTIASPWNSMLAYVAVLTEQGKRPWCYLRNRHITNGDCGTWPG